MPATGPYAGSKRRRVVARTRPRKSYRTDKGRLRLRQSAGLNTTMRNMVFPKTWKRAFNYVEKITIDPGAGGTNSHHYFSCNSLYDPNRTGTGHQPLGFDELVGVAYDHFVVTKATLTATFVSDSTSVAVPSICGVSIRDTSSGAASDPTTDIERGDCEWTVVGPVTSGNNAVTIKKTIDPIKWLGRKGPLSDPDLKGSSAANPSEECFFCLFAAGTGADDPPALDVIVSIVYEAVLIEPKALTQS